MAGHEDRLGWAKTELDDRPCQRSTVSQVESLCKPVPWRKCSVITVFGSDVTEAAYAVCQVDVPQIADERQRRWAGDRGHGEDQNGLRGLMIALANVTIVRDWKQFIEKP